MNCTYTAQGTFVCKNENKHVPTVKNVSEYFAVNDTPNEKIASITGVVGAGVANNCQAINTDFMTVSARHNCSATANIDSCAFSFICKK
jgi:hypothetical protein